MTSQAWKLKYLISMSFWVSFTCTNTLYANKGNVLSQHLPPLSLETKCRIRITTSLPKQKWLLCRLWLALKGARRRSLLASVARQDSEIIYFRTNRAQSVSVRSSHLKAVFFTKMCDFLCLLPMEALNFCENKCWNVITEDLEPLSSRSNLRGKKFAFSKV